MGWSANMAKIMAAQADAENDPMYHALKNMPRVLEINPKSPLIEGLLSRVLDLPPGTDEPSPDELELAETARLLFDSTLVRSGFDVADPISFFDRIEALLRQTIGVRLDARTDDTVRPAPPVASEQLEEHEDAEESEDDENVDEPNIRIMEEEDDDAFLDWDSFKKSMEHDEL